MFCLRSLFDVSRFYKRYLRPSLQFLWAHFIQTAIHIYTYKEFSTKDSEEPVQALDTELLGLFIVFPHEIKMNIMIFKVGEIHKCKDNFSSLLGGF